MAQRLLLLSNSTNPGEDYLAWPRTLLRDFLGPIPRRALFVPFAGVRIGWDEYAARVQAVFMELGHSIASIHAEADPVAAVGTAEVIVVGGGNTFQLLDQLYRQRLLEPIRARVGSGVPYVGWSAGSNVACPTIRTTNDMPIAEPPSFAALGLVPFQLNAHFTDAAIPNHGGETRTERLLEFIAANPALPVVALPEGTALRIEDGHLTLLGGKPATVFVAGRDPEVRANGPGLAESIRIGNHAVSP